MNSDYVTKETENTNKKKIIIVSIIAAAVVCAVCLLVFIKGGFVGGDVDEDKDEDIYNATVTAGEQIGETGESVLQIPDDTEADTQASQAESTNSADTETSEQTETLEQTSTSDRDLTEEVSASALPQTKEDILLFAVETVENTRDYSGKITASHTVDYDIKVTEVPGGNTVMSAVNKIIDSVAAPTDETLSFVGGTSDNQNGKTQKLLLPQDGDFYLYPDKVKSASIDTLDGDVVVTVTLLPESCTSTSVPTGHASSVGYLDVSSIDFGIIDFSDASVDYTETVIKLTVSDTGIVKLAEYEIPFTAAFNGKVMGFSATVKLNGKQHEIWNLSF